MLDEKKKTILVAGTVVLLLLISLVLVVFSPKTYVVEFDDGVNTYSIAVKKNEKLYKPSVPSKEGYIFLGWYKEDSLYDFSSEVKEDFELVAKFKREGQEEVEMPEETTTTTTTAKEETTTTTTKKNETTKKNTTTKKVTTNAPVATTAPTTVAPTTTRPTTTVAPTTTTKAVTYSVVRVDVANSTIGQQMIYIKNNSTGSYVAGTVTITYTAGNSATVSVPASGLMVVKSTIASVSNPKGY